MARTCPQLSLDFGSSGIAVGICLYLRAIDHDGRETQGTEANLYLRLQVRHVSIHQPIDSPPRNSRGWVTWVEAAPLVAFFRRL